ncbi:hypothetical protein [Phytoactinopolyspora halotolerans]|uniref:HPr kinase/phosphorylase C-terminal domain-containing protein n=1 Tax=Phytoactinopolyspora halotolerans TaxID=1981512 RepID=A0A6L9S3I6_9ACTN|nr:hypothetical protein [Phytoactinopolyspora halotolerans]NED99598.1 hypothetical protein [Phytoactinopolyspora halotolerans]
MSPDGTGRQGTQLLYGLRVASEIPLYQDRSAADDGEPDVTMRMGEPIPEQQARPPGRELAHMETDRPYYTFTVTDTGDYALRFYRTCDFVVDSALRTVTMHVVEGADPGVAGVLAAGAALSFVLTMRRHTVLHASAVQIGDAALAFVGYSGMGKSTMAALMCADGARLITDDVLRVDPDGDAMRCRLGATELRLRKAASELAERFSDRPPGRVTSDDRDALRMVESTEDRLPLAAIVVPWPDRDRTWTELERLSTMDALVTLLRFPRLLGWTDSAVLDRQFSDVGDVVERVPVYRAQVPWGPPFGEDIAETVAAVVGLSQDLI